MAVDKSGGDSMSLRNNKMYLEGNQSVLVFKLRTLELEPLKVQST